MGPWYRGEEGADRLIGLDLREEEHFVADLDPQIGGFAAVAHQLIHRAAGAFDHLGAAQEGRADAEGAGADVPDLTWFFEFYHGMALQRDQGAVDRGHSLTRGVGQFGQRHTGGGGEGGQQA